MEPIFPANPIERVGWYGGRIATGLLGEPLNLFSDICFVIVIIIFYVKLRKEGFSDTPVLILFILGGFVGLGGAIFHSHPNRVTLQIDLIPITIFGLSYIFFSMRRFFNHSYKISFLLTITFLLFTIAFERAVHNFRIPGINHVPSIMALTIIGLLLMKNRHNTKVGKALLIASAFYWLALFFRYLDLYIYRSFPLGTHFLWHIFTACVVGILLYTAATYKGSMKHTPAET